MGIFNRTKKKIEGIKAKYGLHKELENDYRFKQLENYKEYKIRYREDVIPYEMEGYEDFVPVLIRYYFHNESDLSYIEIPQMYDDPWDWPANAIYVTDYSVIVLYDPKS